MSVRMRLKHKKPEMFKIKIDRFISFQSSHTNYHIEHWLKSITGYLKYGHSQIFIITWIRLHADSSLDHFCQNFGDDELSLFSSFTFGLISLSFRRFDSCAISTFFGYLLNRVILYLFVYINISECVRFYFCFVFSV